MPAFHWCSTSLDIGSIIQPGNWGRIVRKFGWNHGHSGNEAALEHIRLTEFSHLPSRLDAAFYLADQQAASFYGQGQVNHLMVLYEVELLQPEANSHRTYWDGVRPSGDLGLEWARKYWRGEPPDGNINISKQERLTLSALKVVRRIEDF